MTIKFEWKRELSWRATDSLPKPIAITNTGTGPFLVEVPPPSLTGNGNYSSTGLTRVQIGPTVDAAGNLYGTDRFTGGFPRIVRIKPARVVSTFDQFADANTSAYTLAVDAAGNVYTAPSGSLFGTVVRITPTGVLTIVAGATGQEGNVNGTGAAARFAGIGGLAVGPGGDLYATDGNNFSVRRIRLPDGEVTTVSGFRENAVPRDGVGTDARFEFPGSIAAAPNGDLLIGDVYAFRCLSPTFVTTTFVGKVRQSGTTDATGNAARFIAPRGIVLDSGNAYVADAVNIRKITTGGEVTTTLSAIGAELLAPDSNGGLVAASANAIWRVTLSGVATLLAGNPALGGYVDAIGADAVFGSIGGLAVDSAGNVFVTETIDQNSTLRRITPAGVVTTWAGVRGDFGAGDGTADGARLDARFAGPGALAFDGSGNLFVADTGNRTIRRISTLGDVSTVAGTAGALPGSADGTGQAARFAGTGALAFDNNGRLLIGDQGTLRRMTSAGEVTTVMGVLGQLGVRLGNQPRLNGIGGMAVRPNGRVVLTSEAAVLEATLP